MLQSVEAIVEPSGRVRLLEELRVDHPSRAVVTLIETSSAATAGNADDILSFLARTRLPAAERFSAAEIDAQIDEERKAWD